LSLQGSPELRPEHSGDDEAVETSRCTIIENAKVLIIVEAERPDAGLLAPRSNSWLTHVFRSTDDGGFGRTSHTSEFKSNPESVVKAHPKRIVVKPEVIQFDDLSALLIFDFSNRLPLKMRFGVRRLSDVPSGVKAHSEKRVFPALSETLAD